MNISIKILTVLFLGVSCISSYANDLTVSPGTLGKAISTVDSGEEELVIKGNIGASDFEVFSELPSGIKTLDLSGLSLDGGFVATGDAERQSYFKPGELPAYLFFGSKFDKVILPENLVEVGEGAFADSDVSEVIFPGNCSLIASYAFYNCKNLKNIQLPEKGVKIEEGVFGKCVSLENINIPAGSVLAGKFIFQDTAITDLDLSGVASFGDFSISSSGELKNLTVNENVVNTKGVAMSNWALRSINGLGTEVPDMMAAVCPVLSTDNILENVSEIGDYAFADSEMEMIILGGKINYIGEYSFAHNNNIIGIDANALEANIPDVAETAFAGCDESKIALYVTYGSYDAWMSHPYWSRFDIHRGADASVGALEKEKDVIAIRATENGVRLESNYGIGNYSVTATDGVNILKGYSSEEVLDIDLSQSSVKVVIVKVWNHKGEKTVTLMR